MKIITTLAFAGLVSSLLSLGALAAPASYGVDQSHSRIAFTAYTSLFNANGTFKKWSGKAVFDEANLAASKVEIDVETASVDTNSEGRDEHLVKEDFFFSEKFPKATFRSKSFKVKDANNLVVTGELTIRGVTKTVKVPFKFSEMALKNKDGSSTKVRRARGAFRVNRHDFGVSYKAGLVMPSIKKDIDIVFDVNFKIAK